jgi:hypothetical protein
MILDSNTKAAIPNVQILLFDKSIACSSDSLGKFHYSKISGCPDFELYFNKKGYTETSKKYRGISHSIDTILLIPLDIPKLDRFAKSTDKV